MNTLPALLVAAVPALLLACGFLPSSWANRHVRTMRRLTVGAATASFGLAIAAAVALTLRGTIDHAFLTATQPLPISVGIYFDSLAAIMTLLITWIGLVIVRYSIRYLDGECTQGRFLRWISFTLGAVLLLVVSRNLVMFTGAWILTSFGLHQLLTHYADRPAALLAARKKFLISRLGDFFLILALVLTYRAFGSFEYTAVFAEVGKVSSASVEGRWMLPLIGAFYVLGAMTKSAQFPMHSWLPDTMETPTPVSALMHAGIINAGGFLVLRLSPLVSQSHLALDVLAMIGAMTALFAAVVMLTQTSVKRALAYSTIAQMGFMMLQCGLGAFSAALLHLVAHSLYKAHAFLSSGSVLELAARTRLLASTPQTEPRRAAWTLPAAAGVAAILCLAAAHGFGISLTEKPGGVMLGLILTIALLQLLWKSFQVPGRIAGPAGILAAAFVALAYYGAYTVIDQLLATSTARSIVPNSTFDLVLSVAVAIGFLGVFALQASIPQLSDREFFKSLYVHASNGFYVDIAVQKLVTRIWGVSTSSSR